MRRLWIALACLLHLQIGIAEAQVGVTFFPGPGMPNGGVSPVTIAGTFPAPITTSGTVFTWNTVSVGTGSSNRWIYVSLSSRAASQVSNPITSLTIDCGGGAVAMNNIAGASNSNNGGGNINVLGWFVSASSQPTGTTCNFVGTFTFTTLRASIGVYAVTTTTPTPSATATDVTNLNSTATITVPANGGALMSNIDASGTGNTCTALSNATLEGTPQIAGTNTNIAYGHDTSHSGSTTYTFTCPGSVLDPVAGFLAIGP